MIYKAIDPLLQLWAKSHCLHLYTKSRDEEIRSVDVVGSEGQKCQLWVMPTAESDNVRIHVWDYNQRRREFNTTLDNLHLCLEEAYATARQWNCEGDDLVTPQDSVPEQ
jgi:hypothetical protein